MAESGLLSVDLELLFGPVNVEQGWQFLSEGRVYGARAESPDVIAGCIRGTLGESYEVSVTMRRERSGVAVDARCSCAARGACGHAVAVICHFVQLDRAGSPAVEARMDAPDAQWLADFAALASQCTTAGTGGSIRYVVTLEPDGDEAPHVRTFITQHDRSPVPYDPSDVLVNEANVQLEGADRTLLYELTDLGYGPQQGLQLDGVVGAAVFARIVETGRCTLQHASGQRLGLASPRHLVLDWRLNAEDGRFQIRLQSEPRSTRILNFSPLWYIDAATGDAGPIDTALPRVLVEELSCAPSVAPEGVGPMLGSLRRVLGSHLISVRDAPQIDELSQPPCHAVLHLSARRHADSQKPICEGQLSFEYAGLRVHPAHATSRVVRRVGERFVVINRSMEFETQAQRLLSAAGLIRAARGSNGPAQDNVWKPRGGDDQWPQFFIDGVPTLEAQGWTVEQDETFPFHRVDATRWLVNVSSIGSGDLVSVDICANEDGEARSVLRQVAQCLVERGCGASARPGECTALTLSDGGIVTAPLERVERIQRALAELGVSADAVAESGTLRVSRFQAAALVALDAPHVGLQVRGDAAVVSLGRRIAAFSGIRELPAPPGLGVTLRPYQRQALGWLGFLAEIGCGGCLADDMGLGKTVQMLAHLWIEKLSGKADRPSLVVAPTSVIGNWLREAERIVPEMKVAVLHGARRHMYFEQLADYDICITSYALLPRDEEALRRQPFHLIVLDEAQNIKNPRTRAAVVTRRIESRRTIALTGTPVENHLGELWALFSVLVPGLLGSEQAFRTAFRKPIERNEDSDRAGALARRLAPFMLRRTKAGVAPELPPRTEILHTVALSAHQARVYERVREEMDKRLRALLRDSSVDDARVEVLTALLRLRQVCCDPRLMGEPGDDESSSKFELLLELVPSMLEAGHRILLFSQFTSMLDLIANAFTRLNIDFLMLTGATRDRQALIDRFQAGEVPVFLVSLKAGGTGLNLTAADTVIHYDPWWNPAVQEQASDRAHRIGQRQPVFIHKLLTEGTVEQRINDLQATKQRLADGLFEGRSRSGLEWTTEQLDALLAPVG